MKLQLFSLHVKRPGNPNHSICILIDLKTPIIQSAYLSTWKPQLFSLHVKRPKKKNKQTKPNNDDDKEEEEEEDDDDDDDEDDEEEDYRRCPTQLQAVLKICITHYEAFHLFDTRR